MRDEVLRRRCNVAIDTTAPTNRMRSLAMQTKLASVDSLLVVVASREALIERTAARGHSRAVEAWDGSWKLPGYKWCHDVQVQAIARTSSAQITMCSQNCPTAEFTHSDAGSSQTPFQVFTARLHAMISPLHFLGEGLQILSGVDSWVSLWRLFPTSAPLTQTR